MVAFLRWLRSIVFGTLNSVARFALLLLLLIGVLILVGLAQGDGLPSKMVLALDLRHPLEDSSSANFRFGARPVTVMDIILGLDAAERDDRVKGIMVRLGDANLPISQAEEIGTALQRFRKSGKFVIAHSQGFDAPGLGDYLTASAADQIWMQPRTPFGSAGEGGGEIFLRGLFDKIQAEPQIVKRSDYKSAADMFMEKSMTPADREQLTALMQSWYNTATAGVAEDRHLTANAVAAVFEASPQLAEDAQKARLIDRLGFDDEAYEAALARAGAGARYTSMADFVRAKDDVGASARGPYIALIAGNGEIVEGSSGGSVFGSSSGIAGDDMARAIREAAKDKSIRVILLRIDSPGGSVTASDQILDAVKKARAKGIPVVVSMGSVAASGGYYISTSANKIVAEPGTITGSIGVLTGKVSVGKSLALIGVGVDQVGVGKNALMDSSLTPFTPEQLASLNTQVDSIYADFKQKVATGRKLSLEKVEQVARGRVWSGADASKQGLVDQLGGFWTAAAISKQLANIPADQRVAFKRFPRQKNFFQAISDFMGDDSTSMRAVQGFVTLMNAPPVQAVISATSELPRGGIELRATNLPR
ncbi:MAG: signal peptide peptidase SppA, type [Gammaproteobacteria bacterium]|nr:signal peptide peptidase SppA, type [Gammaproteobacteria bacterium]